MMEEKKNKCRKKTKRSRDKRDALQLVDSNENI